MWLRFGVVWLNFSPDQEHGEPSAEGLTDEPTQESRGWGKDGLTNNPTMSKSMNVFAALWLAIPAGQAVYGAATVAKSPAAGGYDIAAYYWPAYHPEARWNPFFKGNIGEWEIIRDCKPGFPGHQQPNVPLWGYENEAKPRVMEKKIAAASSHGVNVLIFDWYWYDNQSFLEE